MVVLDADSLMTGAHRQLVRLMERHPDSGIIQTAAAAGHQPQHPSRACSSSPAASTAR
ncbi:MAG: hypothetical protein IPL39_25155 [Opitutaceae bacterium]|nr:hypothetical protein [Opitutaceae bacterium]